MGRPAGVESAVKAYGTLQLTVASPQPAFDEPFSIEEAKGFIRSQTATNREDSLIADYIAGARATAELEQGRDLVRKQWDLHLDGFCGEIALRRPLHSVSLVRYTDSNVEDHDLIVSTDYIVDTARGLIRPPYSGSWPSFTPFASSAVLVRFISGLDHNHPFWSHDGARVKQGMRWLITEWYWNRLPFVVGSIAELPYGVVMMLRAGAEVMP